MGIRHAKPYTLRGGPSTKLEQRSNSQTHILYLHQGLPAKIEIVVISRLGNSTITQRTLRSHQSLIVPIFAQSVITSQREITPPLGFSAIPITNTMFAATTPENTPIAYRASISANPNPVISSTFIEANYEALESLLRDLQRQMRNNDLRTELEYFREDYDKEREMEPRPEPTRAATPPFRIASPRIYRRGERIMEFEGAQSRGESRDKRTTKGGRHLEEAPRGNGGQSVNLPPLLVAYLGRGGNGQPFQKAGSILDYKDLKAKFRSHFSQQKKFTKTHLAVHKIKQRKGKSTRAFITRYTDDTLQILDLPSTYKGLMEKTYTWVDAREVATNGALKDRRDSFKRSKQSYWDNNRGPNLGLLPSLSKILKEILTTKKAARSFEPPPKMFRNSRGCKIRTTFAPRERNKKERTKSSDTLRGESKKDKGTAPAEAPILMHCFEKLNPTIKSTKVDLKTPLVGFLGERSWSIGEVPLEITIGDALSQGYKFLTSLLTIMVKGKPFNTKHKLNEYNLVKLIKQNKRGLGPDRNMAACKETKELTKAGILQKVKDQTWVANPVMVKKRVMEDGEYVCTSQT
ncbi:hypothetical protein Tco_1467587 [Tanacetum coccineum]